MRVVHFTDPLFRFAALARPPMAAISLRRSGERAAARLRPPLRPNATGSSIFCLRIVLTHYCGLLLTCQVVAYYVVMTKTAQREEAEKAAKLKRQQVYRYPFALLNIVDWFKPGPKEAAGGREKCAQS